MDQQNFKQDAHGRLVPIEHIKPIDLARDELVQELVNLTKALSANLADFKKRSFGDIQAFIQMSADEYGVVIGGKKGNVTLMSFDGKYKIQRANQENITFDERIHAAKGLIDECLKEWTSNSRSEIKALIDRAFEVDKEGNLNIGRILTLRRVTIEDERWKKAMQAIGDSVQVLGSKSYIRIYERVGDTEQYKPISLDIASI